MKWWNTQKNCVHVSIETMCRIPNDFDGTWAIISNNTYCTDGRLHFSLLMSQIRCLKSWFSNVSVTLHKFIIVAHSCESSKNENVVQSENIHFAFTSNKSVILIWNDFRIFNGVEFRNCMLFQAIHSCYSVFPHLRFEFYWTVSNFALLSESFNSNKCRVEIEWIETVKFRNKISHCHDLFRFFFLVSWFFHSHFQLVKRNAKKYSRYLNSFNGTCKKFLFRPSRFHAIRVFVTFVEQL